MMLMYLSPLSSKPIQRWIQGCLDTGDFWQMNYCFVTNLATSKLLNWKDGIISPKACANPSGSRGMG